MALVLDRQDTEGRNVILIEGGIEIRILRVGKSKVKILIEAPGLKIMRGELVTEEGRKKHVKRHSGGA